MCNQEVLDTTHTHMAADVAADAAGLSLVEEANGRSAWTFAKRPLARLILQGIKEKPEINGETAALHGFDDKKKTWTVSEESNKAQRFKVKRRQLSLQVEPPPAAFSCDAVQVVDAGDQKRVVASQRFNPGDILFAEPPILRRSAATTSIYTLGDDVERFFALPEADRENILALHANDTINIKHSNASQNAKVMGHDVERSSMEAARLLDMLVKKGCKVPEGQEAAARRFLLVWDTNSYTNVNGEGIYLLLSRMNHSCRPNAQRMPDGDSFYVVALRTIQPGEEVVHSYLREAMLFEPRDLRHKRLRSWFPSCWCERCSSEYDDVRCFPCAKGGGGVCMVKPSPEGDTLEHPNSVVLLRAEGQIRKKYIALEEGQEQITPPAVQTLLQLAQRMLGVGHWLLASIADLAQDMATQMGLLQASELPKQERLKSLNTAAQLATEWVEGWRAVGSLPPAAQSVATRHERAGDLLTAFSKFEANAFLAAVEQYLLARSEMAALAALDGHPIVRRIEGKLKAALNGEVCDQDLPKDR